MVVKSLADPRVKIEFSKIPQFKESEPSKWQVLYLAKLKACEKIADFTDIKKDVDLKEQKKECLIEIIDLLDEPKAADYVINEKVLREAIRVIKINLFRTFSNKGNLSTNIYSVHFSSLTNFVLSSEQKINIGRS